MAFKAVVKARPPQDWLILKLDCGHKGLVDFKPVVQNVDDINYVRCAICKVTALNPLPYQRIVGAKEFHGRMRDVPAGIPYIVPSLVLLVQPSVPPARRDPFAYAHNVKFILGGGIIT